VEDRIADVKPRQTLPQNPAAKPTPDQAGGPAAAKHDEDEERFDASEYVRQLIARMGGGDDPPSAPTPVATPTPVVAKPVSKPNVAPADPVPATATPLQLADAPASLDLLTSSSTISRSRDPGSRGVPEKSVDLNKLREAANIMTSSALHTFECKGLVRRAYSQLSFVIVSLTTNLVLLSMTRQPRSVAYEAALVLLVTAAVATCRFWVTTSQLNQKSKSNVTAKR
jgi:hypothetical protein